MLFNQYVQLKQRNIDMFLISSTVENIIKNYEVDIYDQDNNRTGYQRPPIPTHYRDIAKYLLNNSDSIFMPSAIIGAVNKNQIRLSNQLEIDGKIRIVDGQHRIKGFEYALHTEKKKMFDTDEKKLNQLNNFEFPIILMVIDESKKEKLNEIVAFIDINSKGKKVSTDLAINLRNEMYNETLDYLEEENKLLEKIATETTLFLSKDKENTDTVWFNAIKTVPNDKGKIISINSFNKSLFPIIKQCIQGTQFYKSEQTVSGIINSLRIFISSAWEEIHDKWTKSFNKDKSFNKAFNIQKGIGVHALHLILADCIAEYKSTDRDMSDNLVFALGKFRKILDATPVTTDDWNSGGKFSGYNSASGFKKVKNYILTGEFTNEEDQKESLSDE
ncbi:DNA sulfur modification protein DndB [Bacillus anthracis]|uniref:DGQHR domain-containing protein n=1 Tax=Bacillus anthracis TaxID=1392 RepID=UPI003B987A1C